MVEICLAFSLPELFSPMAPPAESIPDMYLVVSDPFIVCCIKGVHSIIGNCTSCDLGVEGSGTNLSAWCVEGALGVRMALHGKDGFLTGNDGNNSLRGGEELIFIILS